MRRRELLTLLGGAAAWPVAARAQQAMPTIGLLNGVSNEGYADRIASIREGLNDLGFAEGRNLAIAYRSADGKYDRLPGLAAELVRHPVALILAIGNTSSPRAAKAATTTIPIVFAVGNDPVLYGLVSRIDRPEGNVTGVALANQALSPKRLEILRELIPAAVKIGFLLNPDSPASEADARDLPAAAHMVGRELAILSASTDREIDNIFSSVRQQGIAALLIQNDAYLNTRRNQIVALAAQYALPVMYGLPDAVQAGGLVSYAPKFDELFRQAGQYAGRILKGEKPGDLPVLQPVRYEMVLNLKTAKALGLTVPLTLQVAADEVIE